MQKQSHILRDLFTDPGAEHSLEEIIENISMGAGHFPATALSPNDKNMDESSAAEHRLVSERRIDGSTEAVDEDAGIVTPMAVYTDPVYGTVNPDVLIGSDDNDEIYGGYGNDTIQGQGGNDLIVGMGDSDFLYGGGGDDHIYGGYNAQGDVLGDDGQDTMNGGPGDDHMWGGNRRDTMNGGADDDEMYGENAIDTMYGGTGVDTMYGGRGNDIMRGQDGSDTIYGGADNDEIRGGSGGDTLYGDSDSTPNVTNTIDRLYGYDGNDTLYGGGGGNAFTGGAGDDKLYGGNLSDGFIYGIGDSGDDTIYRFTDDSDKIDLTLVRTGLGLPISAMDYDDLTRTVEGADVRYEYDLAGLGLLATGSILIKGGASLEIDAEDFLFNV